MLFTFAACGAPAEQGGAADGPALGVEKTLLIGIVPDYESFDPALAYEVYAPTILRACYDSLMVFGADGSVVLSDSCTDYSVSEDGLTYTFNLKEGMVFASGNPVTAEVWKWSIERVIAKQGNGAFMADTIESMETPDENTLVFHMNQTDPAFLTKLTYPMFGPVDQLAAEEQGATNTADDACDYLSTYSLGSGPYVVTEYVPKVQVVLSRNENFWGEAPYYDKIILQDIESASQVMMVQAGDLDIALNIDAEQAKTLANADNLTVVSSPTLTQSFLLMNCDPSYGPISDPLVQKAITLAIDYEGIQKISGSSTTPVSVFPVGLMGTVDPLDAASATDVDAAKALMKEAGYEDGFTVDFYVPTANVEGVDLLTLAQKVQSDLLQLNIETNIIAEDVMISLETYRTGQQSFGLWYWSPDYPDNSAQLAFLPGSSVGLRANWTAEMNPELADLGAAASAEPDNAAREALLNQIQEEMAGEGPFTVLSQFDTRYAVRNGITGVDYNNLYKLDLRLVTEE